MSKHLGIRVKIKPVVGIFIARIRDFIVHCTHIILCFFNWLKRLIKRNFQLDANMASYGSLFLFFSALLFTVNVEEQHTATIFGINVPVIIQGSWVVIGTGIVASIFSLFFGLSVFCKPFAIITRNIIKTYSFFYWLIFFIVYLFSWLKGLTAIPGDSIFSPVIAYLGFFWLIVIPIIAFTSARERNS